LTNAFAIMQISIIFTQAKRNTMNTITRTELIDCIASSAVAHIESSQKDYLKVKMINGISKFDNFKLCEMMLTYTGNLMQPKTSQIIEFIN